MKQMHKAGALGIVVLLFAMLLTSCGEAPATNMPPTPDAGSAEDFFREGNELAQAGNYEEAITAYQAALGIDPEHVSALANLGVAYYNNGQLEEAITQYQKALEISSEDADIHSNLAAAYVQQGRMEEALESYLTAIRHDPNLSQAYFGLGVVYLQSGESEKAIEAFENFQKYDPGQDTIATEQAARYLEQLKGQ